MITRFENILLQGTVTGHHYLQISFLNSNKIQYQVENSSKNTQSDEDKLAPPVPVLEKTQSMKSISRVFDSHQNLFSKLDDPLVLKILSYLDVPSLCYARATCLHWQALIKSNPSLWLDFEKWNFVKMKLEKIINTGRSIPLTPFESSSYYNVNHTIQSTLKKGKDQYWRSDNHAPDKIEYLTYIFEESLFPTQLRIKFHSGIPSVDFANECNFSSFQFNYSFKILQIFY